MDKNWIMNNKGKKILKIFHILLAASVIGGLASILSILLLKQSGWVDGNTFPVDFVMLMIFKWEVSYTFLGLLVTSFVYGLFTEWGLVKHWWIITKWILVAIMFTLVWAGLGPAINGMTSISDAGLNQGIMSEEYYSFTNKALVYSIIEIVMLIAISVISVLKPWGSRNAKRAIKQKVILIVLLPLIVIGIGFTVLNTVNLNKIRNMPIENIDLTKIEDGTYQGEAKVGNYVYKVKVEVKEHKIIGIVGVDNRKSPYVTYAEGVFQKIIKQQKIDVDAVTGATTTSKAFMKAVENALD